MRFKNLVGKPERESPKRTISASGELELLQMVLEPDTERCASKDVGPQRRWIVKSHIGWRGERSISYKGVKVFSYQTRFKNFEGKPKKKSPKRTISVSGSLGRYKIGHSFPCHEALNCVIKLMGACFLVSLQIHFVVAACENMISATGMRPSDIVTASNGKTIEVYIHGFIDTQKRIFRLSSFIDCICFVFSG